VTVRAVASGSAIAGSLPPGGATAPTLTSTPTRGVSLAEDVPSRDDADLEGSSLVGAAVVEQVLGGRVIEERNE
jgi:DNA polymerase-3 subunit gamma/tau